MDGNVFPFHFSHSVLPFSTTNVRTRKRKLLTILQMRIHLTRLHFSFTNSQKSFTCSGMCLLSILTTSPFFSPSRETHILEDTLPEGTDKLLSGVLLHSLYHSSHTLYSSEDNKSTNKQTNKQTNIIQYN